MAFKGRFGMGNETSGTMTAVEPLRILDAPEHPCAAELLAYWNGKRGPRPMPDRADIVPAEIVRLLPNLLICEALRDSEDFRTRIFGTALVQLVGEERTGKCLSEFGERASIPTRSEIVQDRWFEVTHRAYREARPVLVTGTMSSSDRPHLILHGVCCPLTAGGSAIAQMLGGLFIVDKR